MIIRAVTRLYKAIIKDSEQCPCGSGLGQSWVDRRYFRKTIVAVKAGVGKM